MSDPYTDEQLAMDKWRTNRYIKAEVKKHDQAVIHKMPIKTLVKHLRSQERTKRRYNHDRQIYKRKMKRCKYCKTTENLTVDHKTPLIRGGQDIEANWQCLCGNCNNTKSALTDGEVHNLFKWFVRVQESRTAHGKKPYTLR